MKLEVLRTIFFPEHYRSFKHARLLTGLLRAGHIISFSVLVGGVFFQQNEMQLTPWVIATIVTGLSMFVMELYPSCIALFEIRCISILVKIAILAFIPLVNESIHLYLLLLIIAFSALISHASRKIKHATIAPRSFLEKYGFNEK